MPSVVTAFDTVVGQYPPAQWNEWLADFEDATLYQTWHYGAVSWGQEHLSHLLLMQGETIVGMAQFRLIQLPILSLGIAYLRWGPLYRRRVLEADEYFLTALLAAMKREFAQRRRLFIRMLPGVFRGDPDQNAFLSAAATTGFKLNSQLKPYRTLRLDLTLELDELRQRMEQKWRNQLNAAERYGLRIREGQSQGLFKEFIGIYRTMMARKHFDTSVDVEAFAKIQQQLPQEFKLYILLGEKDGKLMAGLVGAVGGNTGIYLLGATSTEGMKSKGAYLLQWRFIQILKERGYRWYDLGGINPERNPGVFHFKAGLSGKEAVQLGCFELSGSLLSRCLVRAGERVHAMLQKTKSTVQDAWLKKVS